MATKVIDALCALAQLDYDAVVAYQRAIDSIDPAHGSIEDRLRAFQDDHERHIETLGLWITRLGGKPPKQSRDFKGILIEGMTAVQSAFGTEGALRAMVTNEKLTNASYEAALHDVTDAELREVLQGHKDDEQRHLEYVQNALDHRLWERLEQTASV